MNKNKLLISLSLLLLVSFTVPQHANASNPCKDIKLPKVYTISLQPNNDIVPIKYKMQILYKNVVGGYTLHVREVSPDKGAVSVELLSQNCAEISFTLPSATYDHKYTWNCIGRLTYVGQKNFQGTCNADVFVPGSATSIKYSGIFAAQARR